MYQYLSGKLVEKIPTLVTVDVQGIGYLIHIPVSTYGQLPSLGEPVKLLTHYVVREDFQGLYGFFTEEEREMFRLLISISGIGPKMGMTVLSGSSLAELKQAIVNGNLDFLTKIPGIGRKTAERIVVELKEKIIVDDRRLPQGGAVKMSAEESMMEDSLRALIELGYKKQNAKEAIQKALNENGSAKKSVSDLIRVSLKYV